MSLNPILYQTLETPLGPMIVAETDGQLVGAWFNDQRHFSGVEDTWQQAESHVLTDAIDQLQAYFAGQRDDFDLPLAPTGTAFQQSVWKQLRAIEPGDTCSYGDIANQLGRPAAVRAVGAAVGRNPLSILIPCHRVVGRDGSLTGYAGGLDRKRWLLQREKALTAATA